MSEIKSGRPLWPDDRTGRHAWRRSNLQVLHVLGAMVAISPRTGDRPGDAVRLPLRHRDEGVEIQFVARRQVAEVGLASGAGEGAEPSVDVGLRRNRPDLDKDPRHVLALFGNPVRPAVERKDGFDLGKEVLRHTPLAHRLEILIANAGAGALE